MPTREFEQAALAAEELAESVVQTVRNPLVVLDADLRVAKVNRAFIETFGIDEGDAHGKPLFELGAGRWDIPELRALLTEVLPKNTVITDYEVSFESDGGGPRAILVNAQRMHRAGIDDKILLSIEDVTEVRAQRYELERINRELESFSYSVSHDLRAPLRAIDGFSRAFEEDYGAGVDDEGRRLLAVIRRNTAKMGKLIDDLLAFSRLSRREVEPSEVDMAALARSCYRDLLELEPGREVELRVAELPPVMGDGAMLEQVWSNLLGNALKYTRPRSPAVIEIAGEIVGDGARYTVTDNGVGFDMQYADKLFGVFQRLHRESEFEGTGVGLALVRRIIERHGGQIEAASTLGSGAIFTFTLPREVPYG